MDSSLEERIAHFDNIEKGPFRAFAKTECNLFTLYSLPNGISVFKYKVNWIEGKCYKKEEVKEFGIDFNFIVIENNDDLVIIKNLSSDHKK